MKTREQLKEDMWTDFDHKLYKWEAVFTYLTAKLEHLEGRLKFLAKQDDLDTESITTVTKAIKFWETELKRFK